MAVGVDGHDGVGSGAVLGREFERGLLVVVGGVAVDEQRVARGDGRSRVEGARPRQEEARGGAAEEHGQILWRVYRKYFLALMDAEVSWRAGLPLFIANEVAYISKSLLF